MLGGRDVGTELLGLLGGFPFNRTRAEIDGMTYREMWEGIIEPAIKSGSVKTSSKTAGISSPAATTESNGGFDPRRATESEMDDFLTKMCGDRKYEGPRWWIPGEVPGIKRYQGPDKG